MSRKNKKYSKELKIEVVKEYLKGEQSAGELTEHYDLSSENRIYAWVRAYEAGNTKFIETRGRLTGDTKGRPKKIKSFDQMSKDEYIEYLELENKILKELAEMLEN